MGWQTGSFVFVCVSWPLCLSLSLFSLVCSPNFCLVSLYFHSFGSHACSVSSFFFFIKKIYIFFNKVLKITILISHHWVEWLNNKVWWCFGRSQRFGMGPILSSVIGTFLRVRLNQVPTINLKDNDYLI